MSDTVAENEGSNTTRLIMMVAGALGGLGLWLLVDVLDDIVVNQRLHMVLIAALGSYFTAFLAFAGPMAVRQAALVALPFAILPPLLLFWISFRYDTGGEALENSFAPLAFAMLVSLSLPFVIAHRVSPRGWRDYPALFNHAWGIVVRYLVALVFVGLFWGVIFLSNALFDLVGITWIDDLLDIDVVPYLLTGGALGLAIAVVNELTDYVSPHLIFRLLRLLLPIFTVVVMVFVIALPLRGLDGVFRGLSEATVLMSIAIFALTLITVAVATSTEEAVTGRIMRGAVMVLSALLPVVAGLAAYAVWLRVDQYGWTPVRLLALLIAALLLAYGVIYALSVLRRGAWMERIRNANTIMALVVIALSVLWQTPLLNAERISANSQFARFAAGDTALEDLDLWEIGREWGRPGQAVIARLAAMDHADQAALDLRLARLEEANSRYDMRRADRQQTVVVEEQEIATLIPVLPAGATLPEGSIQSLNGGTRRSISEGCAQQTEGGNPGCLAILADLIPENSGDEMVIAYLTPEGKMALVTLSPELHGAGYRQSGHARNQSGVAIGHLEAATLDRLHGGAFSIAPSGLNVLTFDDISIFINPR